MDTTGGYNGYDIAIFDIGENLVSDVGRKNSERTDFDVELVSDGTPYSVGQINNTGGDFINVVLLDVTGIPGIPPVIDAVRIIDVSGTINPTRESIDLDGVLRLNHDPATQTLVTS
jgi:hypothetical protein